MSLAGIQFFIGGGGSHSLITCAVLSFLLLCFIPLRASLDMHRLFTWCTGDRVHEGARPDVTSISPRRRRPGRNRLPSPQRPQTMAREHNLQDFNNIWECKALANFPQSSVAKLMLERVAKQVEPICISRKWRVKLLQEFFPSDAGLQGMNVNHGQVIHIRLRPSNKSGFLPWPHILGTLLHEMVHMAIGPHNAAFYALLDELWAEVEKLPEVPGPGGSALMVVDSYGRPVTGDAAQAAIAKDMANRQGAGGARAVPFIGEGHRLGAGTPAQRSLPPHQRREAAAAAAEARLQRASIQGVGGRRLGGGEEAGQTQLGAGQKRPASDLPSDRAGKAAMIAAATERRLARARADAMACGNHAQGHAHARGPAASAGARAVQSTSGSAASATAQVAGSTGAAASSAQARPGHVEVIELDEEGQEVRHSLERPSQEGGTEQEAAEEEVVLVEDHDAPVPSSAGTSSHAAPQLAAPSYQCPVCTYLGEAGSQALACEVCGTVLADNSKVPAALVWSR